MNTFKDLVVWQKSRRLVALVYKVTEELPKSEQFGLTSQARRSAVSIPSNIAEGYRRKTPGEYTQFLAISAGSATELETQIILINDLFKLDVGAELELLEEVQKMLSSLIKKVTARK